MTMPSAGTIPPGPAEKYDTSRDLLGWLEEQFKRYGDIYQASIHGFNAYVISAPDLAEHVLRRNWQNYTKGWAIKRVAFLLGNGLMVSEGEFWQGQRRMIQPAFHRTAVAALVDVIAAANDALRRRWEQAARDQAAVNVTRDVSLMILEIVLKIVFGHDADRVAPHFTILSDESGRTLQFAQLFRALGRIVLEVIVERRGKAADTNDILGMLMAARDRDDGHAMSDRQLVNEVMTLVVAGHETTASALNWAWYLLSRHPAIEATLASELARLCTQAPPGLDDLAKFTYTRQVLDEVLRLYPPGWLMTRRALGDDRIGGYLVSAGTEIYISPYLIHRNPRLWHDPDRFDPDRFGPDAPQDRHPLAQMPFSAGPRNCIGETLARVEMQIHLMTIAGRLRMRHDDPRPPEFEAGVNLRSRHDFIMTPELRVPASG
jgi:cytochrome P450